MLKSRAQDLRHSPYAQHFLMQALLPPALELSASPDRFRHLAVVSSSSLLPLPRQAYTVLQAVEPYVHQVLAFAHQAQEQAHKEQVGRKGGGAWGESAGAGRRGN